MHCGRENSVTLFLAGCDVADAAGHQFSPSPWCPSNGCWRCWPDSLFRSPCLGTAEKSTGTRIGRSFDFTDFPARQFNQGISFCRAALFLLCPENSRRITLGVAFFRSSSTVLRGICFRQDQSPERWSSTTTCLLQMNSLFHTFYSSHILSETCAVLVPCGFAYLFIFFKTSRHSR